MGEPRRSHRRKICLGNQEGGPEEAHDRLGIIKEEGEGEGESSVTRESVESGGEGTYKKKNPGQRCS